MRCDSKIVNDYLIQMKNKNKSAFEDLYNYTSKLIYAYILSITRNVAMSEDIHHDTYIKIAENIDKYNSGSTALSWIIKIAKNTSLTTIVKENKMDHLNENEDEIQAIEDYSCNKELIDIDLFEYMKNMLSEENREVLVLHIYGGYSHKEIAGILNLPVTTVQWRYRSALKKVKKYYEGEINNEKIRENKFREKIIY